MVPEVNYHIFEFTCKTDGLFICFSLDNCYCILTNGQTLLEVSWCLFEMCLPLSHVHSDFVETRTLTCKRYLRCVLCHTVRTSDQTVYHSGIISYITEKLYLLKFLVSQTFLHAFQYKHTQF